MVDGDASSRLAGVNEIVSTLAENGCEQSLRLLRVGGGTRTGRGGGVRAGSVWNCVSKSVLGVWVGLVLGTLGGELKNDLPTWPSPGGVLLPTGQFNLCWSARDRCLLPEHRSWGIANGMVVSPNGQNIDFRWHEEGFLSTDRKSGTPKDWAGCLSRSETSNSEGLPPGLPGRFKEPGAPSFP